MAVPCLMAAWTAHERELAAYLGHRLGGTEEAEDILQEVFIRAFRQGRSFCAIDNPRAWLFQVARNALTDRLRAARDHAPLPDDIAAPEGEVSPSVDDLSQCLPRVLSELSADDRLAITFCDIAGKSQQEFADHLGISLPGAKSRVQRARQRLKSRMESACHVRFDDNGQVCCFTPRPPLA